MTKRAAFAVPALCVAWVQVAFALDINSFRAQHKLPPLSASSMLAAAYSHAADMASRKTLDHNGATVAWSKTE